VKGLYSVNTNVLTQRFQPVHLAGRSLLARCLLKIHRIDSAQSVAFQERQEQIETKPDLSNSGQRSGHQDRRAFPRRFGDCTISIIRNDQANNRTHGDWAIHSTSIKGELIDISLSGIAFSTEEELSEKETLRLRITNRSLQSELDRTATVLRTSPSEDGLQRIICQFHHNLPFEQIRDFGYNVFESTLI